jgi:hypothetical protein
VGTRGLWLIVLLAAGAVALLVPGTLAPGQGTAVEHAEEATEALGLREASATLRGDPLAAARAKAARDAAEAAAASAGPVCANAEGVYGRIVDGLGRAIPGADVRVFAHTGGRHDLARAVGEPLAAALSDGEGAYKVGPLPEGEGRFLLRASGSGYAPSQEVIPRRGCRVDLILEPGGGLDLAVESADGLPAPGAWVALRQGYVRLEGTTDLDGRIHLRPLPTGEATLVVVAPDASFVRQQIPIAPGEAEPRTVVLEPPFRLRGRVLGVDDEPLVGARLLAHDPQPYDGAPAGEPVESGEGGRFEVLLPFTAGHSAEIEVQAEGYPTQTFPQQIVDGGEGGMEVVYRLSPTRGAIEGTVEDRDGKPVGGILVAILGQPPRSRRRATSSEDGTFRLDPGGFAPGSRLQLAAFGGPRGQGRGEATVAPEEGPATPVRIVLEGAGEVAGTVKDAAGLPLEGARLSLDVDMEAAQRQGRGGHQETWAVYAVQQDAANPGLAAVTDAEGRYRIEGVPALPWRLAVRHGLEQMLVPDPVVVAPGERLTRDVVFSPGQTIEGFVRGGGGAPLAGASVHARLGGGWTALSLTARSQGDGSFRLRGASEGTWNLRVSAPGHQAVSRAVPAGAKDVAIDLVPLGWIEGVVTLDGEPHRGAFEVHLEAPPRREHQGYFGRQRPTSRFNGGDGAFRIPGLQAGDYKMTVTSGDWIGPGAVAVRVADGRATRADVALSPGASIQGTFTNDEGAPLAAAYLAATPVEAEGGRALTAQTDPEGRFVLRGLVEGTWRLDAKAPGQPAFQRVETLSRGQQARLQLVQPRAGAIAIQVTDPEGRPLAGVRPTVKGEAGGIVFPDWELMQRGGNVDHTAWQRALTTDEAGRNLREFVAEGRYEVSVPVPGQDATAAQWVSVRGGATTDVTLVVGSGG